MSDTASERSSSVVSVNDALVHYFSKITAENAGVLKALSDVIQDTSSAPRVIPPNEPLPAAPRDRAGCTMCDKHHAGPCMLLECHHVVHCRCVLHVTVCVECGTEIAYEDKILAHTKRLLYLKREYLENESTIEHTEGIVTKLQEQLKGLALRRSDIISDMNESTMVLAAYQASA